MHGNNFLSAGDVVTKFKKQAFHFYSRLFSHNFEGTPFLGHVGINNMIGCIIEIDSGTVKMTEICQNFIFSEVNIM